jgi:hypothetical protein
VEIIFFIRARRNETLNSMSENKRRWNFNRCECVGLAVGICLLIAFGVNLERRTALRREPMTDLGVFAITSEALWSGGNIYTVTDWHGWHYQYAPTLAVLFLPLAEPLPQTASALAPGEQRTAANTPWGYGISGHNSYYGLHDENRRFFWIVAAWYLLSVLFIVLSAHALACALEGRGFKSPPPEGNLERRRWWTLRLLPLLVCGGSLGTELSRGQVDVLMLVTIAFGIYLAANNHGFKAGIWLSFPAAVKLYPPFLLVYPFWRLQWRMTAGVMAGLFLFLLIIPMTVLGPKQTIESYRTWVQVLAKPALGQGTDTSRLHELTGMTSTDNQSLLATIHNWRYHFSPRNQRPQQAAPGERYLVYIISAVMLAATGFAIGIRRRDSRPELLVIAGLLIGLTFIVSPVAHNYYYLLMLPLVTALLHQGLPQKPGHAANWKLLLPVLVFMLTDLMVRMPFIGAPLRDLGAPLLSLIFLMWSGAMFLVKQLESEKLTTAA